MKTMSLRVYPMYGRHGGLLRRIHSTFLLKSLAIEWRHRKEAKYAIPGVEECAVLGAL